MRDFLLLLPNLIAVSTIEVTALAVESDCAALTVERHGIARAEKCRTALGR